MNELSDKKIAVLVDNYFEQTEFSEPVSALRDAGAEVTIISTKLKRLHGLHHVDPGDDFNADLLIDEADPDDYDALVLPGGAVNADALRDNETAQQWVREFLGSGRPTAAICHAPWLLVSAGEADGRRLTSYHTIRDDMRNAGAVWTNEAVVVDDNLITSRQPDDLPEFNQAIIDMLEGSRSPHEIKQTEAMRAM